MLARIYGMDLEAISNLTIAQFNHLVSNIEYVVEDSKNFGKPPPVELPKTELIKYAEKCSIEIPYQVQLDLLYGE